MTTETQAPEGAERKVAEQSYANTAFNYPEAPIGSRDWCLFWDGWQARAALADQPITPESGSSTAPQASAITPQSCQASAEGDAFDVSLDEDAADMLRQTIGDDEDAAPVRLTVGDGHSGYGLYVSHGDYPEEGAVLLRAMQKPVQPQPKGAPEPWTGYHDDIAVAIGELSHAMGSPTMMARRPASLLSATVRAAAERIKTQAPAPAPEKNVCPYCESEWVTLEQHDYSLARERTLDEAAALCEMWNTSPGSALAKEIRALKKSQAPAVAPAKPVAQVYRGHYGGRQNNIGFDDVRKLRDADLPPPGTLLYAAPPDHTATMAAAAEAIESLLSLIRRNAPELSGKVIGWAERDLAALRVAIGANPPVQHKEGA